LIRIQPLVLTPLVSLPTPSTGAVVKPLPSRTWGASLSTFLLLAKAHALCGAYVVASVAGKLPARWFLEAYKERCDLGKDEFRRTIARLFFYHK